MRYATCVGTVVLAMSVAPVFARQSTPPASAHPQTPAQQSSTTKSDTQKAGAKTSSDEHFVMEAANGGMAEVELGKLAADKASSDEVKKFGERMVDDHGKANEELKTLAKNKNITLPAAPDAKTKATIDKLSKLSGESFDRAYMQDMVKDHKKDVAEFKTAAKSAQDPDIKAWAAKTLPTLEEHLKLAQEANKAVGTSGTMPKTPKK
jgi:putative membrane protein